MKQLLIGNASLATDTFRPEHNFDLLPYGDIIFFESTDQGRMARISTPPTKNFGIALGRRKTGQLANSPAFVIPEVDLESLTVTRAKYYAGETFSSTITIPTVVGGNTYTLILVKKGTVFNERNKWTASVSVPFDDITTTAADIAEKLGNNFKAMADSGSINVTVTVDEDSITIAGINIGEGFVLMGADALLNVAPTSVQAAAPGVGTPDYIKNLASQCAAGKGFDYTYNNGESIYPGYPEDISESKYNVYTFRFKVGRASSKTRDEKVWQLVHIAIPISDATSTSPMAKLIEDMFMNDESSSDSSSESSSSGSEDNP